MKGAKVFSYLDGGQDSNGFRNSTWQVVSGWGVSFGENVVHEGLLFHFLQNGGTTFSSCAQEFPAWPFLEGASVVP